MEPSRSHPILKLEEDFRRLLIGHLAGSGCSVFNAPSTRCTSFLGLNMHSWSFRKSWSVAKPLKQWRWPLQLEDRSISIHAIDATSMSMPLRTYIPKKITYWDTHNTSPLSPTQQELRCLTIPFLGLNNLWGPTPVFVAIYDQGFWRISLEATSRFDCPKIDELCILDTKVGYQSSYNIADFQRIPMILKCLHIPSQRWWPQRKLRTLRSLSFSRCHQNHILSANGVVCWCCCNQL